MIQPCKIVLFGSVIGAPCPDCGHVNVVHVQATKVCSVCEVVAEVREELAKLKEKHDEVSRDV